MKQNWPHYTEAPAPVRAALEIKMAADVADAISYGFQRGFRFDESDVVVAHLEKYTALRSSDAPAAIAYRQRYGMQIESELRALTKVRSLAAAFAAPHPRDVHAAELAATRAAEREAAMDRRATELIELQEAAERVRKIAAARKQLTHEEPRS